MNKHFDTGTTAQLSVNMFNDLLANDPFSLFAQMRSLGAVVEIPFPIEGAPHGWMVTRMEEAVHVLKDSKHFTVDRSIVDTGTATRQRMPFAQGSAPTMTDVDGLDHRRLRGLVARVFTPKYIQSLRPSIQQIADTLLDQVEEQGSMDLVEN
jgi:cytochrome P450